MATTPVVYDSASQRHRPLGAGETLGASALPVSTAADNLIEARPDGLYAPGEFVADDPNAVKLTGDQTVQGVKTFSSPVVASLNGTANRAVADADGQTISLTYVRIDDVVALSAIDAMFA